ncbi:hypothetical protein [Thalassotalea litorea]|uniref:hypothetical protein n=1 Tax=Thalassotalea litorea TaxID=2020715 RepID=UPI003736D00E
MKVSDLQNRLIDRLKELLPEWKFVKGNRTFKRVVDGNVWHFHVSCINHESGFDCTGDVAVEFKSKTVQLCIIGAELGNIDGVGQKRFSVSNAQQATESADAIYSYFVKVGIPFLEKYGAPKEVVKTLEVGGKEAMLISPIANLHKQQIESLAGYYGFSM